MAALPAIKMAERIDPRLSNDASIQFESGMLSYASGDSAEALVQLRSAESASDLRIASTSRWFSGITLLKSGKTNEAASYICGHRGSAAPDPAIITSVGDGAIRDV